MVRMSLPTSCYYGGTWVTMPLLSPYVRVCRWTYGSSSPGRISPLMGVLVPSGICEGSWTLSRTDRPGCGFFDTVTDVFVGVGSGDSVNVCVDCDLCGFFRVLLL